MRSMWAGWVHSYQSNSYLRRINVTVNVLRHRFEIMVACYICSSKINSRKKNNTLISKATLQDLQE